MSNISIARQRGLYSGITDQELPDIRRDISQLREQISSGKRINRPSDGPTDYSKAKEMGRLDNKIDRRLSSVETAQSFVDRTQQELDGLGDLFAQAQEKGVQAANDTVSDEDREAIAQELRSIKDEAVDRLNARHNGEYIFAGNRTQTTPFNDDGSVNGTPADISGERTRPISQNQTLTTNIPGSELHQYGTGPGGGPKTITGALDGLINAVEPGNSTNDIQANLDEVTEARDHVFSKGAEAGTIGNRLSAARDQLEATQLNVRERQSNAEDTNLAQAASALQQKQTQLQAALKAVATTQQQASLVNFL
jgi:flagellar hook-associated protein 3 FlgL